MADKESNTCQCHIRHLSLINLLRLNLNEGPVEGGGGGGVGGRKVSRSHFPSVV